MSIENRSVESSLDDRELSFGEFRKVVLEDYRVACESRQASILARREVLTGKAKFGITGDGKEIAQIAMAKVFRKGDFRSGYYRSEEHTSELQSLMRISYADFCLKKKKRQHHEQNQSTHSNRT